MKSMINLVGVILILLGILIFVYQGITYTKHDTVAKIGNVEITAESQKNIYLPPIAGGIALVAGIVLVIVGQKRG